MASLLESVKAMLRAIADRLPDRAYLYLRHCWAFNKVGNPWRPRSFNDHTLRLMMARHDPRRRIFADKLATRDYVEARLGAAFLPTLYVETDDVDQIDFTVLPDRFIIKASHGSGMNHIVLDKAQLDIAALRSRMRVWLQTDYSKAMREYVYRDLKPRIFAEQLLEIEPGKLCYDYKLFCFHGVTKLIHVIVDRVINQHRRRSHAFYSADWERIDMSWGAPQSEDLEKPPCLDEMQAAAAILARDFDFLRVDLYLLGEQIIVGELTNFSDGGMSPIKPTERDYWLGGFFDKTAPNATPPGGRRVWEERSANSTAPEIMARNAESGLGGGSGRGDQHAS